MESNSTSGSVVRRKRQRPGSLRYYPFNTGSSSGKEIIKEEVVRLGVELSLSVVESMFLLCDDIRTMLSICFMLWRDRYTPPDPVLERLLRVMHYVYSKYIKPKNGVYRDDGNSVQWRLIKTTWEDFSEGIVVMQRFVIFLMHKKCSFDNRLLLSAIAKYKLQVLKKLEDKLRSAKDVSEANGFARDTIEPITYVLWKSLFNEEAKEATWTDKEIRSNIISDLFTPIMKEPYHSEIVALPPHHTYILGEDFAKQELKEEVVQLGVKLSLYVAESMFLLCDDIRTMLWFCYKLWTDAQSDLNSPDSPVVERLLCVMHYVYSKRIKSKNGEVRNYGKSVQWRLITTTWENFADGIMGMHRLVFILRGQGWATDGREFTSSIEDILKKLGDKLRSANDVSKANGFARDATEPSILDLWKSIFDKEARKVIKDGMLGDLFLPVCFKEPPC